MTAQRAILAAVRLAISAALIWWVLRRADLAAVIQTMRAASLPWLIATLGLGLVGNLITSTRWRLLLRVQGVQARLLFLLRSVLVALFFNNFLPSTIGGDSVRVVDSWRAGASKAVAVSVILVDRFLGLTALILFAAVGVLLTRRLDEHVPYLTLWVGALIAGGGAGVFILLHPPAWLRRIAERPDEETGRVGRLLSRALTAFHAFEKRYDALSAAFGLSVLLQLNVVLAHYLVARSLGFDVPFVAFFAIVPLSYFVMMLPISINAIGVRESMFAFFLAAYGVGTSEAVAFAWLIYVIVLTHSLIGGALFAFRGAS